MASLKARRFNPIAFTPWPVTVISSLVYISLLIPIIVIQVVVPPAPKTDPRGVNITEAWDDLQELTDGYHPFNSRRNDEVHQFLLERIEAIIDSTKGGDARVIEDGIAVTDISPDVFVFNDEVSNLTYSSRGIGKSPIAGVYFESTNIIVYIRGSEDERENWWEDPDGKPSGKGGVLVNAHYDSVSTGYGATDDGVGVVTLLQLLRYFTTPGHRPRKGLVLLFNNGEEDFLNGARVFSQHPMAKFAHTFLNLEGAGAGGRAALFRSTDTEVTRFYQNAKHPFGSVVAGDGFKMGLIRSETDYVVFNGMLGLRGLDVAFIEPRARYHTDQDDARHTSVDSIWHMLSAAIGTTEGLVSYEGSEFDPPSEKDGQVDTAKGTIGVWFDVFGSSFAVFQLHTLFALSVTLLVVAPLVLLVTGIAIRKKDRMYLFSNSVLVEGTGERVPLYGLRGLFRYPIILVMASAASVGLAYLLTKFNPFIIHSSPFAVWSMMLSVWVFLVWFFSRVAEFARPSVLQRAYGFTWLFILFWVALVVNTVYSNQKGLAAGYFVFFYFLGTFMATWVSYFELAALPRKSEYAAQVSRTLRPSRSSFSSRLLSPSSDELPSGSRLSDEGEEEQDEPTESTALLRGGQRTTFANYTRTYGDPDALYDAEGIEDSKKDAGVFAAEQQWSWKLPRWIWLLQLLLMAPVVLMFVGPLGLILTSAMSQVGSDGVPLLVVYLSIATFSILLLLPLLPFLHRFTYHIPTFLLLIFTGTLIYNLSSFPFSAENRLKLFFLQEVNLDNGSNTASLIGMQPFVRDAISSIPSARGQSITCDNSSTFGGREKCSWSGIDPQVVPDDDGHMEKWVTFNVSRAEDGNNKKKNNHKNNKKAHFEISGKNTRACRLKFDTPIRNYTVHGSALDERMPHTGPQGVAEIRLWSRTWERVWSVDVEWGEEGEDAAVGSEDNDGGLSGKVICIWSDYNTSGVIPALDELRMFAPTWVGVTKFSDGLVEGSRAFNI
ncbi:hypothetical protein AJ80_03564 [Polytolypa hystricis UAMH7299]|uniref:Peptide hydrolase n=1 Tax=Polytolypa hystricis (strain UAMH7299) TaxID=1447883 RepID=A0A2B7YH71_POLH7|nr:hypothetical protein AJ80_03564 [Polytolypa hystricis UAMH7299]